MNRIRTFLLLCTAGALASGCMAAAGTAGGARDQAGRWGDVYASPVGPAPQIDSTFVLEDYLRLAERRSPGLRAVYQQWMAAVGSSEYAGSLPNPVLSYGHFLESVETRVGPQKWRLGIRQTYPWFGTLGARSDGARESAEAAREKFEARRLRVFYEVRSAYSDLYYLGRDIALTRENLQLLAFWESVARTKYKVALTRHADVIRAQVELGKLENRLKTLEARTGPAASRLAATLDLPIAAYIPVPVALEVDEVELDKGSVLSSVKAANPDLSLLRHAVGEAEAGLRLAGKSSYPSLSFGVDYIDTGESASRDLPGSGKDAWVIGVGLELPIWFGKNRAIKAEAEAKRKEAEYSLVEGENRLLVLAEQAVFEHDDALRKLRLYRDGLIPKAEQSLNVSYAAYQAGELDFLNVLDAQRQLLAFQMEMEEALATLSVKQAEIEMICGRRVTELAGR
jgi:cobalt-zinc-cadmium efflux system outer membrane protein